MSPMQPNGGTTVMDMNPVQPSYVAPAGMSPMQPNEKLGLILEKGNVDYGINIIIGEQVKTLASFSYEKWYKSGVSNSDGIWVGSGISEQYIMKPSKVTADMHEDIGSEFGYVLQKGKAVRVKLLHQKTEGEDDE